MKKMENGMEEKKFLDEKDKQIKIYVLSTGY